MKQFVQSVSFSLDDPLMRQVRQLVKAKRFSETVRQALRAWLNRDDEIMDVLKRIEAKLAAKGVPPVYQHGPTGTSLDNATLFEAMGDAEGTDEAASALDSY